MMIKRCVHLVKKFIDIYLYELYAFFSKKNSHPSDGYIKRMYQIWFLDEIIYVHGVQQHTHTFSNSVWNTRNA